MTKKALTKAIETFLQTRGEILFVYLFGSFLEGEHFRDIDLGIYINENKPITQNKYYEIELSTAIEEITGCPVDIIVLNRAPSTIIYRASKGKLLKNSDDDLRIDFVTLHWKMYWDFQPILRYHMEERKHGSK